MIEIALRSHCLSAGGTPHAADASASFQELQHTPPAGMERWSAKWSEHAITVLDKVSVAVATDLDSIFALAQEPAEMFGASVGTINKEYLARFGQEVVQGHPLHLLFPLLRKLRQECRKKAGSLVPWQVVSEGDPSGGPTSGRVVKSELASFQGQSSIPNKGEGVVVLSEVVTGQEDIPEGVEALLTASPVDFTSRTAMQARLSGVLLVSCPDLKVWEETTKGSDGEFVVVKVGPGAGALKLMHRVAEDTTDEEDDGNDELLAQARRELKQARAELREAWEKKYGSAPEALQASEAAQGETTSTKKKGWFFGFGRR